MEWGSLCYNYSQNASWVFRAVCNIFSVKQSQQAGSTEAASEYKPVRQVVSLVSTGLPSPLRLRAHCQCLITVWATQCEQWASCEHIQPCLSPLVWQVLKWSPAVQCSLLQTVWEVQRSHTDICVGVSGRGGHYRAASERRKRRWSPYSYWPCSSRV